MTHHHGAKITEMLQMRRKMFVAARKYE